MADLLLEKLTTIFSGFWFCCVTHDPFAMICSFSLSFDHIVSASSKTRSKSISLSEEQLRDGCRLGIDSHADMSCIGAHATILEVYEGKLCNVMPFNDSYAPLKDIKTVNATFAYDSDDGMTYILNVNQALDFSQSMEHSLLCPNQARLNGVGIEDCPRILDFYGKSTHSIYFPEEDLRLPLLMKFPVSFLPVRRPTPEELDNCPILDLTSTDQWSPELFDDMTCNAMKAHPSYSMTMDLSNALSEHVYVSAVSSKPRKSVTSEQLASLWNISLKDAKATIDSTTQDYIRQIEGKLSRRVRTRAHQRQYRQLGDTWGISVLIPSIPKSNRCVAINMFSYFVIEVILFPPIQ